MERKRWKHSRRIIKVCPPEARDRLRDGSDAGRACSPLPHREARGQGGGPHAGTRLRKRLAPSGTGCHDHAREIRLRPRASDIRVPKWPSTSWNTWHRSHSTTVQRSECNLKPRSAPPQTSTRNLIGPPRTLRRRFETSERKYWSILSA